VDPPNIVSRSAREFDGDDRKGMIGGADKEQIMDMMVNLWVRAMRALLYFPSRMTQMIRWNAVM